MLCVCVAWVRRGRREGSVFTLTDVHHTSSTNPPRVLVPSCHLSHPPSTPTCTRGCQALLVDIQRYTSTPVPPVPLVPLAPLSTTRARSARREHFPRLKRERSPELQRSRECFMLPLQGKPAPCLKLFLLFPFLFLPSCMVDSTTSRQLHHAQHHPLLHSTSPSLPAPETGHKTLPA